RLRPAPFDDVEKAVFMWFTDLRSKNMPISGPLIQEKAKVLAASLGHLDFTASWGWLIRFQERFGITARIICGETSAVKQSTIAKCWQKSGIFESNSEADLAEEDIEGMHDQVNKDLWDSVVESLPEFPQNQLSFEDFVNADEQLLVSSELTDAEILQSVSPQSQHEEDSSNAESDDEVSITEEKTTSAQAFKGLQE
ncbi:unnamed protein product, partial [Notodromas monacha]